MGAISRNPNPNFANPHRRKRVTVASKVEAPMSGGRQPLVEKFPTNNNLIMGQVKILKRGDTLITPATTGEERMVTENRKPRTRKIEVKDVNDEILCSTKPLGPDPDTVQRQIRVRDFNCVVEGGFAGSTTVSSPPPSALPLPSSLVKNIRRVICHVPRP